MIAYAGGARENVLADAADLLKRHHTTWGSGAPCGPGALLEAHVGRRVRREKRWHWTLTGTVVVQTRNRDEVSALVTTHCVRDVETQAAQAWSASWRGPLPAAAVAFDAYVRGHRPLPVESIVDMLLEGGLPEEIAGLFLLGMQSRENRLARRKARRKPPK